MYLAYVHVLSLRNIVGLTTICTEALSVSDLKHKFVRQWEIHTEYYLIKTYDYNQNKPLSFIYIQVHKIKNPLN